MWRYRYVGVMVWKCRCDYDGVVWRWRGVKFILITGLSYHACVFVPLLPRLIEEVRDAASGVTLVNDEVYKSSR